MDNYIRLYNISAVPDSAYLLEEGNVFFFASEADKYAIKGKNIIVGATEIILNKVLNVITNRIETAITDKNTKIKKMSAEKFLSYLKSYSFVLNVSMGIAKQVLLTNQIINKNLIGLSGEDKKAQELSIEFYKIMARLKDEFEKRRMPWISEIIKKHETSLTYKRGEAFSKSTEQTKITTEITMTDKYIEFPKDAVICEEGTIGEEMYILKSGTIDVLLQGKKVASINKSGAVFGEIALLLGEKRTATLKARNNVILTKIMKKDIKDFSEKHPEVLIELMSSLAKKHFNNITKISSINNMLIEKNLNSEKKPEGIKPPDVHKIKNELYSLKDDVRKIIEKKGADYLNDLVE